MKAMNKLIIIIFGSFLLIKSDVFANYEFCGTRYKEDEVFSREFVIANIERYLKKVFVTHDATLEDYLFFYGVHVESEYLRSIEKCKEKFRTDDVAQCALWYNKRLNNKSREASYYLRDIKGAYPFIKGIPDSFDVKIKTIDNYSWYEINVIDKSGHSLSFSHMSSCRFVDGGLLGLRKVDDNEVGW